MAKRWRVLGEKEASQINEVDKDVKNKFRYHWLDRELEGTNQGTIFLLWCLSNYQELYF